MPKAVRSSKNPIGLKFIEVMDSANPPLGIADVAKAFDVKVPSVYDWINHGRIAKTRYAQLVAWSGRSLDWWFDIPSRGAVHNGPEESAPDPYTKLPAGLTSAQREVLLAFASLPSERRTEVREALMKEASHFISALREFQEREGVTGTVSAERAAEKLPPPPGGRAPETMPGDLDGLVAPQKSVSR